MKYNGRIVFKKADNTVFIKVSSDNAEYFKEVVSYIDKFTPYRMYEDGKYVPDNKDFKKLRKQINDIVDCDLLKNLLFAEIDNYKTIAYPWMEVSKASHLIVKCFDWHESILGGEFWNLMYDEYYKRGL